jgi:hypothetical protein
LNSVQVETVQVDGVGTCIAAVDFVAGICQKTRHNAQNTITGLINSKSSDAVQKILCSRAVVPGFHNPTWVVTYDECLSLINYLPRHHVQHVTDFINKQFKRVRAGDTTLHAEIEARAANGGLEATLARESLGLPTQAAIAEDRGLKRRREELEVVGMEVDIKERNIMIKEKNIMLLMTQYELLEKLSGGELGETDRLRFADSVRDTLWPMQQPQPIEAPPAPRVMPSVPVQVVQAQVQAQAQPVEAPPVLPAAPVAVVVSPVLAQAQPLVPAQVVSARSLLSQESLLLLDREAPAPYDVTVYGKPLASGMRATVLEYIVSKAKPYATIENLRGVKACCTTAIGNRASTIYKELTKNLHRRKSGPPLRRGSHLSTYRIPEDEPILELATVMYENRCKPSDLEGKKAINELAFRLRLLCWKP